jgi:putative hydrolase of the HAD superfamily
VTGTLSGEVSQGNTSELPRSIPSIKAVAFDLDGTLYPNYTFYLRLFPKLLLHPLLFRAFSMARSRLHLPVKNGSEGDSSFYDRQAEIVASILGKSAGETKDRLELLVYRNWEKNFSGIKTFPRLKETLLALRGAGLRLGVLSDFPPVKKLSLLGLDGIFDAALASEETGALKPSVVPFNSLAGALGAANNEILYVGNSVHYDVEGAKSAGMKAALIMRSTFSTGFVPKNSEGKADFVFRDYRQLQDYILQ